MFIALRTEHIIDGETGADLTEKFNIIKVEKPLCIVYHLGFALTELDKTLHLTFEAIRVMSNVLFCEHFSHIGSAGGVAYHCCASADKGDGSITRHLKTFHKCECHKMTCGEAVGGAVKTYIKLCFTTVYHFADFILVRYLCNKTACN